MSANKNFTCLLPHLPAAGRCGSGRNNLNCLILTLSISGWDYTAIISLWWGSLYFWVYLRLIIYFLKKSNFFQI